MGNNLSTEKEYENTYFGKIRSKIKILDNKLEAYQELKEVKNKRGEKDLILDEQIEKFEKEVEELKTDLEKSLNELKSYQNDSSDDNFSNMMY